MVDSHSEPSLCINVALNIHEGCSIVVIDTKVNMFMLWNVLYVSLYRDFVGHGHGMKNELATKAHQTGLK